MCVCVPVCVWEASACHWAGWAVTFLIAWARPRPARLTWLITASFFLPKNWVLTRFRLHWHEKWGYWHCQQMAEDSRFVLVPMFLRCWAAWEDSDDTDVWCSTVHLDRWRKLTLLAFSFQAQKNFLEKESLLKHWWKSHSRIGEHLGLNLQDFR